MLFRSIKFSIDRRLALLRSAKQKKWLSLFFTTGDNRTFLRDEWAAKTRTKLDTTERTLSTNTHKFSNTINEIENDEIKRQRVMLETFKKVT